eukprot:scaffold3395_cov66-Phaeocystis_antarctica.AAC.1
MQADARFLKSSPFSVVKTVVATEGLRGMYRGMLPILASTGVQKTVLFTANAGARRAVENSGMPLLTEAIPGTGGLKPGVIVGGVVAAAARTVVETPFELMKVRLQTGGSIRASGGASLVSTTQLAELYTGAGPTFCRATLMLGSFFVLCDYFERLAPELMAVPLLGGFIKGGVCATAGWVVAWPYEVVKSLVQSKDGAKYRGMSSVTIMREIVAANGVRALWRGIGPGALRSIASNGAGMAIYQFTQNASRKDAKRG